MYINNEIIPAKDIRTERAGAVSITVPLDNPKAGFFVMKSKRCFKCGSIKSIDLFPTHNKMSDGRVNKCKDCVSIYNKARVRTKHGLISLIYSGQIIRNEEYEQGCIIYSLLDLKRWCLSQKIFHKLYDKWVKSGYERSESPSIDRKDDYKGYSFDNIQLMSWGENARKLSEDRRNGINNKINKAVLQYDKDGHFIKEYYSISQAARELNIENATIGKCASGVYMAAGGFVWKFKNTKISTN